MFQRPPVQHESAAWLLVALWSLVIFAAIPLARAIERSVNALWGEEAFLYAVFAIVAAVVLWTFRSLRALGRLPRDRAAWLAGVALLYFGYTWSLRHNPVEALHFVQYGVLGVLAFRALTYRMRDLAIYPAAALVGGIVGILDEAIQWATPERVWDLRDIWFNFVGAALIQVGIAAGIRPPVISARAPAPSVRLLARIAMLAVLLLGASLLNTPSRIAWYSKRVPGLGFLAERSDLMLEYGHLYVVPEVGSFRSRLSPEALARVDAERGPASGRVLAGSPDDDYERFLAKHTPITDPFLHEARVHLFRRDRYLSTAEENAATGREYRSVLTVGQRENRILELHFPSTLRHSGSTLPAEKRAYLAEHQLADQPYESRVSQNLVTRVGEGHVLAGLLGAILLLLLVDRAAGRRIDSRRRA